MFYEGFVGVEVRWRAAEAGGGAEREQEYGNMRE